MYIHTKPPPTQKFFYMLSAFKEKKKKRHCETVYYNKVNIVLSKKKYGPNHTMLTEKILLNEDFN